MIAPLSASDLPWARRLLQERGSLPFIRRGKAYDPCEHPGFVARDQRGQPRGWITYHLEAGECEILTLQSQGTRYRVALLEAVRSAALQAGCWRLWLVTTNDNTAAMRFYQQAGFRLCGFHRDALLLARQLNPAIPLVGEDELPMRDEIEFELLLRELPPPPEPPAFPMRLWRRTVYESEWVGLYLDRVVFPDGRLIPEYHMLHTKDAVAVLVENAAGELLFEHVYRYATHRMEWEIPAGAIEKDEDILETARREVFEETGYQTQAHRQVYTYTPSNGNVDTRFFLTACRVGERTAGIDKGEIRSIRWMKREEIEDLIRRGELQDGFTLAGVLLWWWLKEEK